MSPEAQRWLVCGATGFIGRHLVGALARAGADWHGVARHPAAASGHPRIEPCDMTRSEELAAVLGRQRPDVVVHLAAPAAGSGSADLAFFVDSTDRLVAAIEAYCPRARLLVAGSAAEYGNAPADGRLEEDAACRPLGDYGRAKLRQTAAALRAADRQLDVVVARLFNPIGPGQGAHLLGRALAQRLQAGERPLRLRDANYQRDFVDVRDVVDALRTIASSADPPKVVNVAKGLATPVAEVGRLLCSLCDAQLEELPGPIDELHLWRSVGSPARLARLGWGPRRTLSESLHDLWLDTLGPSRPTTGAGP